MLNEFKIQVCAVSAVFLLLINACAGDGDGHGLKASSLLLRSTAAGNDGPDWNYGDISAESQPDVPQVSRFDIDTLKLPLRFHDYYASFCPPPCPGWVEEYMVETDIEACNPYGVWRYKQKYTQIEGIMGFVTVSVCHFQLPRDEEGRIVDGEVECRGSATDHMTGTLNDFSMEMEFTRRPLSLDGKLLHVKSGLACDWGSAQTEPSYPAECLADADCTEDKICDFDSFTCIDNCNFTPCPENNACNSQTGRCVPCAEECPPAYACSVYSYLDGGMTACMNNCESDDCETGLACQYNPETLTCEVLYYEMPAAEGCDPACPEGFECRQYGNMPDTLICANYCKTSGCPENGYFCYYFKDECRMLVEDYGP